MNVLCFEVAFGFVSGVIYVLSWLVVICGGDCVSACGFGVCLWVVVFYLGGCVFVVVLCSF